jgi:hypothetical protein
MNTPCRDQPELQHRTDPRTVSRPGEYLNPIKTESLQNKQSNHKNKQNQTLNVKRYISYIIYKHLTFIWKNTTITVAHRRGRRGRERSPPQKPRGGRSVIPKVGGKTDEVGGPLGHQKSPTQRMPLLLSSHKPRAHEDVSLTLGRPIAEAKTREIRGAGQTRSFRMSEETGELA